MNLENQETPIQLLPEHLIDQIKAGEVIEKASTLLKELLENSIDAHATSIEVHLINNGLDLISVKDNGKGIPFKDLPLAFHRHATSKISKFEDLYSLFSYGFRGEALASMASISRLKCQSIPNSLSGGCIEISGGKIETCFPLEGKESGTLIQIKDLFYNTPARLKFIKSKNAEKNALKKIIHSFILAHPQIEFITQWDQKEKNIYPAIELNDKDYEKSLEKRIKKILFKKGEEQDLLHFDSQYEGHSLTGYLSALPSKGQKNQYLFVNGRPILDKSLHNSISYGASKIWSKGESGHYLLLITAPPEKLDVNIHPNKTVVKFEKSGLIYGLISAGLEKAFQNKKNTHHCNFLPQEPLLTKTEEPPSFREDLNSSSKQNFSGHLFNQYSSQNFSEPSSALKFMKVSDEYYLVNKEIENNIPYLLYTNRLCQLYINRIFSLTSSLEIRENFLEEKVIPLMISEQINSSKKLSHKALDFLKAQGFECDYLDEQTLALRTIPEGFENFDYHHFFQDIISSFQLITDDSVENYFKSFAKILNKEDSFRKANRVLLEGAIQTFKIFTKNNDNSSPCLIPLDQKNCQRLFNLSSLYGK